MKYIADKHGNLRPEGAPVVMSRFVIEDGKLLIKSTVKAHTRATKTGKIANVSQYQNIKQKSNILPPYKGNDKEAWELTKEEFLDHRNKNIDLQIYTEKFGRETEYQYQFVVKYHNKRGDKKMMFHFNESKRISPIEAREKIHKRIIESAIDDGKQIPPEVLKDYPDLKNKLSKSTVKAHTRATKAGKIANVNQYQNIKQKHEKTTGSNIVPKDYFKISDNDIKENRDYLLREFGSDNIDKTPKNKIIDALLEKKLFDSIKTIKNGDEILTWDKHKNTPKNMQISIVKFNNKWGITGKGNDLPTETGFIAGGMTGKGYAVPKKYYEAYLKASGKLNLSNHEQQSNIAAISGSLTIGQTVKTKHGTIGTITGIYSGRFPYVVTILKEGMPFSSDYSAKDLVSCNPTKSKSINNNLSKSLEFPITGKDIIAGLKTKITTLEKRFKILEDANKISDSGDNMEWRKNNIKRFKQVLVKIKSDGTYSLTPSEMDEYGLLKSINTNLRKSLEFEITGQRIRDGIMIKIAELRGKLSVMIEKLKVGQPVLNDDGVVAESSEAPITNKPIEERWEVKSLKRDIDRLEREARNIDVKKKFKLSSYELEEYGL